MKESMDARRESRLGRHVRLLESCARNVAAGGVDCERAVHELVRDLAGGDDATCAFVIERSYAGRLERTALSSPDATFAVLVSAALDTALAGDPSSAPVVVAEVARACAARGLIAVPLADEPLASALVLVCLAESALDEDDAALVRSVASHIVLARTIARERKERAARSPIGHPSFLQKTVESLPAMIAYWDVDLVCRFANHAYVTWFGVEPEAMIGARMQTFLGPIFELNRPYVEGALRGESQEFERIIPDPRGGAARYSQALYIPDVGPDGVRGFSVLVVDVTHRKTIELALARAKDAAELANHELESFSYSVAHDLRAPLRAITGFGQLLASAGVATRDAQSLEWLSEILAGATAMGKLIDGLLLLSGVTRREVSRARVDLCTLARGTAARLSATFPDHAPELVLPAELHADADPTLAAILIDNLVGNAWKFTSKKVGAVIELGVTKQDGVEMFYVRDNGAGFDDVYADHLFAPFQRLHGASEYPGTGIGLATVERVVRHHGGTISGRGVVDEGATFLFSFSAPIPSAP